ncbi:MAG: hypothetical protein ACRBFS_09795 [Aureispira sp.]
MKNTNYTSSLEQRQLLRKSTYTILPSSLRYETQRVGNTRSFDISFEHIYRTVLTDRVSKMEHLFFATILNGLGAAFYFQEGAIASWLPFALLAMGTILWAYYHLSASSYLKVKITDNRYFTLHKNSPDAAIVERFLEELFERRDAYLIKEYGYINTRLTYNYQLEQFKRLRRLQVWNEQQFEEQCQQLESMHRLLDLGFDIGEKAIQN